MWTPLQQKNLPLAQAFLALALFVSIALIQSAYDHIHYANENRHAPVHRYALPAPIVSHFAFGFNNVLADFYWITAVQDLTKWDRFDTYYPEYFRVISTLDPQFAYPYQFAIFTIPTKKNKESLAWTASIAERGINAIPSSWEIPFYLGVQYYGRTKSYAEATHYIGIAAKKDSSPEMVHKTYASFLTHALGEYQTTRALYETIANTSDNSETRTYAKTQMFILDVTEAVEQATRAYKEQNGVYPKNLMELVDGHYIPLDVAKHFPASIDQATGKVTLE